MAKMKVVHCIKCLVSCVVRMYVPFAFKSYFRVWHLPPFFSVVCSMRLVLASDGIFVCRMAIVNVLARSSRAIQNSRHPCLAFACLSLLLDLLSASKQTLDIGQSINTW